MPGTYLELDASMAAAETALRAAVECAELSDGQVALDALNDDSGEACLGVMALGGLLRRLGEAVGCPWDVLASQVGEASGGEEQAYQAVGG
jgi:hypothetical protein